MAPRHPPHPTMPDRTRLTQPQSIEDLLLYRLSAVLAGAGGIVIRQCEGRFGITRREWRLLALLGAHASGPAPTLSALATLAHLDRPRASRTVSELVQKKLVSRTTRAGDARHVSLALTAEGLALYREVFPVTQAVNLELLGALEAGEVAQLEAILGKLEQRAAGMAERGGLPLADRRAGGSRRGRQGGGGSA
ncbi:MarR family winged helix-turn-helix transcriptional regulator [Cupriavidus sp. USMAA2-4]|uniref:MarR family winged helix-turn-helix transcriptional regulator n=1 Tax=Cupriavidus sp. USMAA2-4 TaxID=876364 RepID=UPI001E568447|nr:MarR family winged helix-turn-helix transcriptional regulator [Cupriavidus sp. USMAA2-4]